MQFINYNFRKLRILAMCILDIESQHRNRLSAIGLERIDMRWGSHPVGRIAGRYITLVPTHKRHHIRVVHANSTPMGNAAATGFCATCPNTAACLKDFWRSCLVCMLIDDLLSLLGEGDRAQELI